MPSSSKSNTTGAAWALVASRTMPATTQPRANARNLNDMFLSTYVGGTRHQGRCGPQTVKTVADCSEAKAAPAWQAALRSGGVNGLVPLNGGAFPAIKTEGVETKWLEDFVSLAETRSFSRSAQFRHVTQPVFSRRIQALEAWAGIDLVDRSSYPTRLTQPGETLHAQAIEIQVALQSARNLLRSHRASGQDVIEFAIPHTLAFTFFPHWLMALRGRFGAVKTRLIALNVHDAVLHPAWAR